MVRMLLRLTQVLCLSIAFSSCKNTDGNAPDIITSPIMDTNIVVSNKTATGFTLTWQPAVDDATAAGNLMYKVIYSLGDNVSDVNGAEANGIIVVPWSANVTTANFSALTNSTAYYVAILAKDTDGNVSLVNTNVITMCVGKRIFLASASNGNLGGKTGADTKCNAQKPVGMGTVKAMLSDFTGINPSTGFPSSPSGRQSCHGDCRSSTYYTLDWVFGSTQRYCTTDYTKKVGDTVGYPALIVNEANVLSSTPTNLYTGLGQQFNNTNTNCSDWTSSAPGNTYVGGNTSGVFGTGGYSFVVGATGGSPFPSCATPGSIVCVEQ